MALKKCCSRDCPSTGTNCSEIPMPMFKFPRDLDRCKLWVRNSGNEKLLQVPSGKLNVRKHLCGIHFKNDQFFDKFQRRLRRHAIPTVFSCKPLSDEVMANFPTRESSNSSILNSEGEKLNHGTLQTLFHIFSQFPKPPSKCHHCPDSFNNQLQSHSRRINLSEVAKRTNLNVDYEMVLDKSIAGSQDGRECPTTIISRIPYEASERHVNPTRKKHCSIIYIEGPWSSPPAHLKSGYVKEMYEDANAVNASRLLIKPTCLQQEIVVHHVNIKTDQKNDFMPDLIVQDANMKCVGGSM